MRHRPSPPCPAAAPAACPRDRGSSRSRRASRSAPPARSTPERLSPSSMPEPVAQAPRPLENPVRQPAMLVAPLGLRAGKKGLTNDEGTRAAGQLAVGRIDLGETDATGNRKIGGGVGSERLLHEVCPDGEGGLGSTETVGLPVIEADPDNGEEARGVADEPGITPVVARARLACYLT